MKPVFTILFFALGLFFPFGKQVAFAQSSTSPLDPSVANAEALVRTQQEPREQTPAEQTSAEQTAREQRRAEQRRLGEETKLRQNLGNIHRILGISTWGAYTVTSVLGVIQYNNQYGFGSSLANTPCVQGTAIFGPEACTGTPWPHRAFAIGTGVLYAGTMTLSFLMPDPNDLAHARGSYADKLNIHKILRWFHMGGMIAQILLGLAVANNWFSLDRANDYGTLQALGAVHMGIGLATWGTLTAAGVIMLF